MAIQFDKIKPGDKLRIVGAGVPGFAKLGDIVTVQSTDGRHRCDVTHDNTGWLAWVIGDCGAARLDYVSSSEG